MITIQTVLHKLNDEKFTRIVNRDLTRSNLTETLCATKHYIDQICPALAQILDIIFLPNYGHLGTSGGTIILSLLLGLSYNDKEVKEWMDFTVEKLTDRSYISDEGKLLADLEWFRKDAASFLGDLPEELKKCGNLQQCLQKFFSKKEDYKRFLLGVMAMLAIINSPHNDGVVVVQE